MGNRKDIRMICIGTIMVFTAFHLSCSSSTSPDGGGGGSTTWFVDLNGSGTGSGDSWGDAFTDLQAAVDAAESGDEIWVVAGVYTSGTADESTPVVGLQEGVELYGGFEGTEDELGDRVISSNPTVLDGEDLAYHVVIGASGAVLDGFIIRRGNADGVGDDGRGAGVFLDGLAMTISHCIIEDNYAEYGAGIYGNNDASDISETTIQNNEAGSTDQDFASGGGMLLLNGSTTQITDCDFYMNTGARSGGGLVIHNSMPTLAGCGFEDNSIAGSYNNGGAVYVDNNASTGRVASFIDCEFEGNSGGYGAGMFLFRCKAYIDGCVFTGNTATMGGGAMNLMNASIDLRHTRFIQNEAAGGGAIYLFGPLSGVPVDIFNCLFAGNVASTGWGGGIVCNNTTPNISSCTFAGNQAVNGGGIYIHFDETPAITNCILWGNTVSGSGSQIYENGSGTPNLETCCIDQAEYEGSGNTIRLDPLWIAGPLGDYFLSHTAAGQGSTSPCVDAGSALSSVFQLETLTTRTDQVVDGGVVDIGYHYAVVD